MNNEARPLKPNTFVPGGRQNVQASTRQRPSFPSVSLSPQTPSFSLKPPKKRKGLWVSIIMIVVLLVLGMGAAGGYFWYKQALNPVSSDHHQRAVEVTEGASIEEITTSLEQAGVVRSALATQWYIRLSGKDHIKAGHYLLSPNQSVAEIITWLTEGRVNTLKVTILPGKTLKQIRQALLDYGYQPADIDVAFSKQYAHPLLSDKPADSSLEGYIYPDTYFMNGSETVEDLLVRSFDEFEKKLKAENLRAKLQQQGSSLYQGITLASIIYQEASKFQDQRTIAQVFKTRLQEGMVLGSDPTFIYAADLLGVEPTINIDSPYNTRRFPGLPPGPISNFDIAALKALVDPTPTDYLYFVAGDDGTVHFARTFEEHEANIAQFCHTLCQ